MVEFFKKHEVFRDKLLVKDISSLLSLNPLKLALKFALQTENGLQLK